MKEEKKGGKDKKKEEEEVVLTRPFSVEGVQTYIKMIVKLEKPVFP